MLCHALTSVVDGWTRHVQAEVAAGNTASDKLRRYIAANLTYMGARPLHMAALLEIIFSMRDDAGKLLFQAGADDPRTALLEALLRDGQDAGALRPFDAHNMAIAINRTIEQFLGLMPVRADFDLASYTADTVALFTLAIRKEG